VGGAASIGQVRVVGTVRQQVHQLAAASGRWDVAQQRSPEVPCFDAQSSSSSILALLHMRAPPAAAPAAAAAGDGDVPAHGLRSATGLAGGRQQLLPCSQLLLVATPHALLLLNAASYAVLRVLWLGQVAEDLSQQAAPSASAGVHSQLLPAAPTAACCAAALQGTTQQVTAVVGALVSCDVAFIGIALEPSATAGVAAGSVQASHQQQGGLSIYQEQPLPPGSVLLEPGTGTSNADSSSSSSGTRAAVPSSSDGAAGVAAVAGASRSRWGAGSSSGGSGPDADVGSRKSSKDASKGRNTTGASSSRSGQVTPQRTAAGTSSSSSSSSSKAKPPAVNKVKPGRQLTDQPVTFHRKVKSSGYGFVQPKVQLGCSKPAPVKVGPACHAPFAACPALPMPVFAFLDHPLAIAAPWLALHPWTSPYCMPTLLPPSGVPAAPSAAAAGASLGSREAVPAGPGPALLPGCLLGPPWQRAGAQRGSDGPGILGCGPKWEKTRDGATVAAVWFGLAGRQPACTGECTLHSCMEPSASRIAHFCV
jgi:hypothetical protein